MPNVVSLKPSALTEAMQKASIVTFHAPWCGHCKKLMPVLDTAAQNHTDVQFFKIDASKYGAELRAGGEFESIMSKVRGFPTVVHFDGKGGHEVHTGARTEEAIVGAYRKFVGGGKDKSHDDLTAKQVNDIKNGVVMFHWTRCGHCPRFMPEFRKFMDWAGEHFPHLTVGTVEGTLNQELSQAHGVRGFPTVRIFEQGKEPTTYSGARSLEALQKMTSKMFGETVAEEEFMSEDMANTILTLNRGEPNVISLKASAFEEALDQPAAVIMAHAPWCGYCKRFAPEFEKLSAEFPHVKFARINWDKYGAEIDGPVVAGVKTYPTVLVVKEGNVFKFNGDRDHLSQYMTQWFPK